MNDQREQAIRAALDQHEDAVLEYPQSGERTRGRRNIQSQRASQPSNKQYFAPPFADLVRLFHETGHSRSKNNPRKRSAWMIRATRQFGTPAARRV
jgi:hypothetical protein